MKKEYSFDMLSEKKCIDCGRKIKLRLIKIKLAHNITFCFKCFKKNKIK